jgi:hypothetical protein
MAPPLWGHDGRIYKRLKQLERDFDKSENVVGAAGSPTFPILAKGYTIASEQESRDNRGGERMPSSTQDLWQEVFQGQER